jgi:hypothetical protein
MVDLSKLQADMATLTGTTLPAVVADLVSLRSQVASLTATIAAGGTVQQSDIDTLDSSLESAITNLQTAIAPDQPATAAAPATEPAPVAEPAPAASGGITTDAPASGS